MDIIRGFISDNNNITSLLLSLTLLIDRAGPDILGALSENLYRGPIQKFDFAIFSTMISKKSKKLMIYTFLSK